MRRTNPRDLIHEYLLEHGHGRRRLDMLSRTQASGSPFEGETEAESGAGCSKCQATIIKYCDSKKGDGTTDPSRTIENQYNQCIKQPSEDTSMKTRAAVLFLTLLPFSVLAEHTLDPCDHPPEAEDTVGTAKNDTITGTTGDDNIYGLGGNDIIRGRGGHDFICGGDGNDIMSGDGGSDIVSGGAGKDIATGGSNYDYVFGGSAHDVIDALDGVIGNDFVDGGAGTDVCVVDAGDLADNCP